MRQSARRAVALFTVICALGVQALAAAAPLGGERRALLIGVNDYDEGCPRDQMPVDCRSNNLFGPTHDVESLSDALQRYWGFRPQDITTLTNSRARRADILAALRSLDEWAKPGNFAIIYFSGHGTSPQNSRYPANLPAADTGALVVAPDDLKHPRISYLVGRTDIRPVLEHLDAKGTEVFAAFDACFSQNSARSAQAHNRVYKDLGLGSQMPVIAATALATPATDESPYRRVYYISAAGAAEPALEIGADRTYDGQPHGAFTDALLRVLTGRSPHRESQSGFMDYDELADAVEDFMRPRDYGHTPVRMPGKYAAERTVARRPIFEWANGSQTPALQPDATSMGVRVRLDASANPLKPSLQAIPGVALVGPGEADAEYIVRADRRNPQQLMVTTPGNEPIYGAGGLDGGYAQEPRAALQSLGLRAALRKLFETSETHRGGLTLEAGFTDATIGETVTDATSVSLFAKVSQPAQALVLHLMGDGTTRIWIAPNAHNPECMQGTDLKPARSQVLCRWGGAEAPYGLDLLYVIAFAPSIAPDLVAPNSTFDAGFVERLTAAAGASPRSVAVREMRFFTVPRKFN